MPYKIVIAYDGLIWMKDLIDGDAYYNKNIATFKGVLRKTLKLFNGNMITKYLFKMESIDGVKYLKMPKIKGLWLIRKYFKNGEYKLCKMDDGSDVKTMPELMEYVGRIFFEDDSIVSIIDDYCHSDMDKIQNKVVNYIISHIGDGAMLVDLPPGFGKTFIAMNLISRYAGVKTILVVPTKNIGEGHYETFKKMGFNDAALYHSGVKNKVNPKNPKILIVVINSLLKLGDKFARNNGYRMILFDEVHKYVSEERKIVYEYNACPIMIGLTGTSNDRLDKLDVINFVHLGEPVIMSEIFSDEISANIDPDLFNTTMFTCKYSGECKIVKHEATGCVSYIETIKEIAGDDYRTIHLKSIIKKMLTSGNKVLVFYMLVESILKMYNSFMAREKYNSLVAGEYDEKNINIGYIVSEKECNTAAVKRIIDDGQLCLSTYSSSGTGINFSKYNCIIFAEPRKTGYHQFIRRIFRGKGTDCHTKDRYLIYFFDKNSPFKGHYYAYKKVCKEIFGDKMPKEITIDL
jgi:hypothetical protein